MPDIRKPVRVKRMHKTEKMKLGKIFDKKILKKILTKSKKFYFTSYIQNNLMVR